MKPRDIVFLAALLLGIGLLIALANFGAEAATTPFGEGDLEPTVEAAPVVAVPAPAPEPAVASIDAPDTGAQRAATEPAAPGATTGAIEGRVILNSEILKDLESYRIRLVELVNKDAATHVVATEPQREPYDRIVPTAFKVPRDSMPRFRVEDVPFSGYGYRVEIIAKGCNGSSAVARLDAEHPFAEVTLALKKPVTFAVRLSDQQNRPHAGWRVEMRPVGDPPGRMGHVGETDRFGSAIIDAVVQGEYAVVHENVEIGKVRVEPISQPPHGYPISVQSATLIVPVGPALRIELFGPNGIGLEGVSLLLYKTDTTDSRRFEALTGFGGVHVFEFLEPGQYQLDLSAEGFQQTSRSIKIEAATPPQPLQIRLYPTG